MNVLRRYAALDKVSHFPGTMNGATLATYAQQPFAAGPVWWWQTAMRPPCTYSSAHIVHERRRGAHTCLAFSHSFSFCASLMGSPCSMVVRTERLPPRGKGGRRGRRVCVGCPGAVSCDGGCGNISVSVLAPVSLYSQKTTTFFSIDGLSMAFACLLILLSILPSHHSVFAEF